MKEIKTIITLIQENVRDIEGADKAVEMSTDMGHKLQYPESEILRYTEGLSNASDDDLDQMRLRSIILTEKIVELQESRKHHSYKIQVSSRNTDANQDYQDEAMSHVIGSHRDQCNALHSISEPLQKAS